MSKVASTFDFVASVYRALKNILVFIAWRTDGQNCICHAQQQYPSASSNQGRVLP